jgi:PKD repeat protein
MKTGKTRRIRIVRMFLLMALLVALQTIGAEASWEIRTANATLSSSAPFQYIVTVLMENNGFCDVTPSLVSGCGSSSTSAPYLTTLAKSYGFNTHYAAVAHPSEPNYVALLGGSTFGYTSDGNCCFQLKSPNLVDRLEVAGITWNAFAEDASGSGTCSFMPPRAGDHYPFIAFSDMDTTSRCANMLTTTSPTDPEFLAALNGATLPNYVWLTPNDCDNMHSCPIATGDAYLQALVPLILSSKMFTTQKAALFIVFDEGNDLCPTGASGDCVAAEWSGPAVKTAYSSTTSYNHYSYLSTLEAGWSLASLTSNDASATPMTEFFGTSTPPMLSASITHTPSSPQVGQTVSFIGSASGGTSPYSYAWNFGDGSTGTSSSVTHAYSSAGTFTVVLTVKDSGSPQQTASSQQSVTVSSPPPVLTARFTYSPNSPQVGQTVSFTGSASGGAGPYSYSWSFGDKSTGTGSSVTHAYASTGSFTVVLTVKDSSSPRQTTTSQQSIIVSGVPPPLTASFTYSPSSPQAGQQVTFAASASGGTTPFTFSWSFGDGSTGTGSSVTHTYSSAGSYTATLAVKDTSSPQQTVTSQQTVSVGSPPPGLTLWFSYSPSSPEEGQQVIFTASAFGGTSPYSFGWSFGDGGSSIANPATHAYSSSGSFTVTVTVTDASGAKASSSQSVSVAPAVGVIFSSSPTSPEATSPITFSASTTGGVSPFTFSWTFGDGGTSMSNPTTQTYASSGSFTVAVTATDASGGEATSVQTVNVAASLGVSFSYSPSSPMISQIVTYTATTSGGVGASSFTWSFGDGSSSTANPATHTYTSGSFRVTVTATDSDGVRATSSQTVIVAAALDASFTYGPTSPQLGQSVSFAGSASGGSSPYGYSWSFGDGSIGTGLQVAHIFTIDGTYQVTLTVTDSQGKTATTIEPLVIGTAPLQDGFTYSPGSPQPGDTINFTGSARGGTPPYSYSWNFGNGASTEGASAMYSYGTAGSYTVTLTVTDSTNRSNNASQNLTIYSPAQSDFKLNTDRSTLNAQPGSQDSLIITVSENVGPSKTIWFDGTITPSGPQISFDPASITLPSQGSAFTILNVDIPSSTPPGPYWIQVNATNGSVTHSITEQIDVAPRSLPPTKNQACEFCPGSTSIIAIIGLAGAVTLVTAQVRRRRRLVEARYNAGKEDNPNRTRQLARRPLE